MLIAMAGLPGTGKSTLARPLAEACAAVILDKDIVRAALFPAALIEYSTRQDDFCMSIVFQVASYMLRNNPQQHVILDGRTFSRRYQVAALDQLAGELNVPLKIIECVCSDASAYKRLGTKGAMEDVGTNTSVPTSSSNDGETVHPAANRDYQLYRSIKEHFEPIREPKLIVDTDNDLADCLAMCLAYLSGDVRKQRGHGYEDSDSDAESRD